MFWFFLHFEEVNYHLVIGSVFCSSFYCTSADKAKLTVWLGTTRCFDTQILVIFSVPVEMCVFPQARK